MTPERVIEELYYTLHRADYSISHLKHYKKAFGIAKTAIERCMVAKKPDYEGNGYDESGKLIYDTAYCPSCRHMFEVDYDAVKHCPDCGQLIDWSDVECI